jgi:hypothetical protein
MSQHFTRSTVSAAFYCNKCARETQHRIDDRRRGPCLECIARNDKLCRDARKELSARQGELFGGAA